MIPIDDNAKIDKLTDVVIHAAFGFHAKCHNVEKARAAMRAAIESGNPSPATVDAWFEANSPYIVKADFDQWLECAFKDGYKAGVESSTLPPVEQAPNLQDNEQYRMQMAAISTAAIGYWKEVDGVHPDYDTIVLRDVAKLYAKYAALHAAANPPVEQAPSEPACIWAACEELPLSEQGRKEAENVAFHKWWKESGHADDPTFTLTTENCAHATWQARAKLATTPAVDTGAGAGEAYPVGNVAGACICGSWPGGECLRCPRIAPAAPTALECALKPDGWIAVVVVGSEYTSVAFRDEKTARAMCVKGEPFAFYRTIPAAKTSGDAVALQKLHDELNRITWWGAD